MTTMAGIAHGPGVVHPVQATQFPGPGGQKGRREKEKGRKERREGKREKIILVLRCPSPGL
jgi:hypothetical protein